VRPDDGQDGKFVEEIKRGEAKALEPLFVKYRQRIYHVCYRMVYNREEALDLTSETFLRAFRAIETFKKGSNFYTWLCQIAINASIDYLRKKGRTRTVHFDEVVIDESKLDGIRRLAADNPVRKLELKELRTALAEAINDLSEDHRAVFALYALQEFSYKEIAEMVGCPIGTVMSRLHYARQRLREALMRQREEKA
jgi:RNA polymerase sigma-70 factor (ECF subfamily)